MHVHNVRRTKKHQNDIHFGDGQDYYSVCVWLPCRHTSLCMSGYPYHLIIFIRKLNPIMP